MAGDTGGDGGTGIDTTVPHSARIWNYWLGGKDNYAVDRMAGEQTVAVLPEIVDIARASREFLGAGRAGTWPPTPGSVSSWTSGPGCPRPTTPTRWPSGSRPRRGWCTWTTIRWC